VKVGDLIRVGHHSVLINEKIGILTKVEQQNYGFRDRYIVKLTDGSELSLTAEQCEVISESR
jgi:hypothetical protein